MEREHVVEKGRRRTLLGLAGRVRPHNSEDGDKEGSYSWAPGPASLIGRKGRKEEKIEGDDWDGC